MTTTKPKALALISGGLDSMLAAKMILEQGIYVEGINFFTGFCGDIDEPIFCQRNQIGKQQINASYVAKQLGIKLNIVDVVEEYKKVVINPKYGYGSHLNPCLDCKIFMIEQAKKLCDQYKFDFIITGEVVGQRPKSQLKHMLPIVAKSSGADDILLRPLSAKHLKPTLPEQNGWVNRELLGSCHGRSRKAQMELVKTYGINEYAQPSGGCCFLINPHYAKRLADLWQARGTKNYKLDDIALLKVGRHLRPKPNFKMIIGREENENNFLSNYQSQFPSLRSTSHTGPLVLIDGEITNDDDLNLAMRITARYCSGHNDQMVKILLKGFTKEDKVVDILPLPKEELVNAWFIS